jgi:hypothetical protein
VTDDERDGLLGEVAHNSYCHDAQITALVELLIEHKLITQQEWSERLQAVTERLNAQTDREFREYRMDQVLRGRPKQ